MTAPPLPKSLPDSARFAIYAAPPTGSLLAEFGRVWLGRDAEADEMVGPPPVLGLAPERWDEITRQARHYGFHGTFKAPFALAPGKTPAELMAALADFSAAHAAVDAPGLALAQIAGFLALVPSAESPTLDSLANGCVEAFDCFRRPETAEQVAKRKAGLTARQSAAIDRWGYPYVFEDYRFHMTLTDRLPVEEAAGLMRELAILVGPALRQPLRIEAVCLFAQANREAPFRLIRRFALAG